MALKNYFSDMRERVASWSEGPLGEQKPEVQAWELHCHPEEKAQWQAYTERWLDEDPRRRTYSNSEGPGQREWTKKNLAISFWLIKKVESFKIEEAQESLDAWGIVE